MNPTWVQPWFRPRQPRYIPYHVAVPGLPQDHRCLMRPASKLVRYQYLNPIRPDLVSRVIPNTNVVLEVWF